MCSNLSAVGNACMPSDTHLSTKHTPFAHLRATGYTNLGTHHGVTSDVVVMGNLNEVVDFNPTAENMARWICEQVPHCYKVQIQESEGNVVEYEIDA